MDGLERVVSPKRMPKPSQAKTIFVEMKLLRGPETGGEEERGEGVLPDSVSGEVNGEGVDDPCGCR